MSRIVILGCGPGGKYIAIEYDEPLVAINDGEVSALPERLVHVQELMESGDGGDIIVDRARAVLAEEFPELGLKIHLPDEKFCRVGQSIAAASLPATEERETG